MKAVDGQGYSHPTLEAEVWLCSPSGRKISPMTKACAADCIREYAEKLGEHWTTQPLEVEPDGTN